MDIDAQPTLGTDGSLPQRRRAARAGGPGATAIKGWQALVGLLLYAALMMVLGLVLGLALMVVVAPGGLTDAPALLTDPSASSELFTSTPFTLGSVAIAGVAAAVAALPFAGSARRAALGLVPASGRWLAIGAAAGLTGMLVNRGVIWLYMTITGDTSNPQEALAAVATDGSLGAFLLLVALGAVLVPVGEELLFRGLLQGWLRRFGTAVAVGVAAVVFGVAHGFNVVLPAAVVLGVLLGVVRERSGSIWPAVVGHAVNNGVLFVIGRLLA